MTRESGFTLIELIVTVAVAGILLTAAIPSFNSLIRNNRATSETNSLLALVTLARNEAVKRNAPVVMCKTTDGVTCSTVAAVTWDKGVIIFVDDGSGVGGVRGDQIINGAEPVVRTEFPLSRNSSVVGNTSIQNLVVYSSDGRIRGISNGTTGLFTITPGAGQPRKIEINVNGRPRIL